MDKRVGSVRFFLSECESSLAEPHIIQTIIGRREQFSEPPHARYSIFDHIISLTTYESDIPAMATPNRYCYLVVGLV